MRWNVMDVSESGQGQYRATVNKAIELKVS
jgi:hypothetical protein